MGGYQEVEIAALSNRIVELLKDDETDPLIKAAALRSAAETYTQAVTARALLASFYKTFEGR